MFAQGAVAKTLILAGFVALCGPVMADDASSVRSVVELFTSQGCSSCPPADKILGELAHDPHVLALSFPVDYWDYIGWKDTLAEPLCTLRQQAYAKVGGRGEVYTPQAIVNGLVDAVGSDRSQIEEALAKTAKKSGVLSVPLNLSERDGTIDISVGAASPKGPQSASVYLIAFATKRTVTIQRGENAGATVTYSNVVRGMTKVGDWMGAPIDLHASLDKARLDGADAYAVILQEGSRNAPSTILAAAKGP
jgi:hypothetical protein